MSLKGKGNLGAYTLTYPVSLHHLYPLRPVNAIMLHKLISILDNAKEPLLQISLTDRCPTALTEAPTYHLFVSQHCLTARAPVNRSPTPISQTSLIQLQKEPLCPLIVIRQAGNHLTAPVIDSANAPELTAHIVYILRCPGERVNTLLNGSILGGKTKGIKAHRVKHIIALHPLKSGVNIRRSHSIPMPDMEVT
ncbi:hypothetical protein ES703_76996 [subsurface metagenome]